MASWCTPSPCSCHSCPVPPSPAAPTTSAPCASSKELGTSINCAWLEVSPEAGHNGCLEPLAGLEPLGGCGVSSGYFIGILNNHFGFVVLTLAWPGLAQRASARPVPGHPSWDSPPQAWPRLARLLSWPDLAQPSSTYSLLICPGPTGQQACFGTQYSLSKMLALALSTAFPGPLFFVLFQCMHWRKGCALVHVWRPSRS